MDTKRYKNVLNLTASFAKIFKEFEVKHDVDIGDVSCELEEHPLYPEFEKIWNNYQLRLGKLWKRHNFNDLENQIIEQFEISLAHHDIQMDYFCE